MTQYFRDKGGQLHSFPDDASPDEMAKAVEAQGNLNTFSQRNASPAPKAYPPIDDVVRGIASGATFGLADEIAAGANTMLPITPEARGSYSANLEAERSKDAAFRRDYPVASTSAELAGGLMTGVPGAAKVMGAKALAGIPKLVKAAGVGAAAGGASGFGSGEGGLGPRLRNAAIPAVAGGALGFALPPLVGAAGKVLSPLVNWARDPAMLAEGKIAQALERGKMTPQQASAQMIALGPNATLADVGGRPMTRLARGAAGASSKAEDLATKTYEGRQAGQGERVAGEAGRTISPNQDFYGTIDDLTATQKAASAPAYEKAYAASPVPLGQVQPGGGLATLMSRPSMRQATQRALRIAAEEGRDPNSLGIDFNAAGDPVFKTVPSWQTLDYVKRGLDDVIEQFRDPTSGKLRLDESGRAINDTKNAFLKLVDSINPDYAAARASYSGPAQTKDALALGRGLFGKDSEITAKRIAAMADGDKAFFRAGVVRALKDIVDGAPDGADAVKRIWGKPILREKLRAAFPDDASFQAFRQAMDRETTFYGTRREVLQGSRTTPMKADIEDLTQHPALPIMGDMATGNTGSALARSAKLGMDWLTRPTGRVADELGPRLFGMDPQENAALLARLGKKPAPGLLSASRRTGTAAGLANTFGLLQSR